MRLGSAVEGYVSEVSTSQRVKRPQKALDFRLHCLGKLVEPSPGILSMGLWVAAASGDLASPDGVFGPPSAEPPKIQGKDQDGQGH